MTSNPVLVELLRGGALESFHRGAFAVLDADGAVVAAAGDIDRPVFPRSAVKGLQALPLVESGAAERLKLTDEELALACSSHGGEPAHVETAASMLAKAGVDERVLECGAHWPGSEVASRALAAEGGTPTPLHNNCSGKHAGFTCLGCLMAAGAELPAFMRGYIHPHHPVMREVTAALEATTGWSLANAPAGIDGCSIPTYGIPLRQLALGFARFGTGVGLSPGRAVAAQRLRQAVAQAPFYVAGTGRVDTIVMEQLRERVFLKVGAEAVYCAALPERGLGIALKIDDGNNGRAAEVAIAALIEALLPLTEADAKLLRTYSEVSLMNWNKLEVGRLRATELLRRAGTATNPLPPPL